MAELLPYVGPALSIFGALTSASGQREAASAVSAAGRRQEAAAEISAQELERQAGQDKAAYQRKALEDKTQSNLVASKLIAAAGASGGTGPQILRMVGQIMSRGSYNRSMDLYNGEELARQKIAQAGIARTSGQIAALGAAQRAGALEIGARSSLISGAGTLARDAYTLYRRYGGGGPTSPSSFDSLAFADTAEDV